jgi:hypothetical protein
MADTCPIVLDRELAGTSCGGCRPGADLQNDGSCWALRVLATQLRINQPVLPRTS